MLLIFVVTGVYRAKTLILTGSADSPQSPLHQINKEVLVKKQPEK